MTLSILIATQNALLNTYGALFNGGTLKVYAGAVPAGADAPLGAATLLGTLTMGSPAFPDASDGTITANAIAQDSAADASGDATFYRAFQSDGTVIEQGSVGTVGAELNLNTTAIVKDGPIQVSEFYRSLHSV